MNRQRQAILIHTLRHAGGQVFRALFHRADTIPSVLMSYDRLLDATIGYLERLKAGGVKYLSVSPATLQALAAAKKPGLSPIRSSTVQSEAGFSFPPPSVAATAAPILAPAASLAAAPGTSLLSREAKESAMSELRARAMVCQKCPHLVASRKNVVFGTGDIHSPLMFVGEAPGADEDEQGVPFVGRAGRLLTKIIQAMGFDRDRVYIANILKCRPDTPGHSAGNRKPTSDEMKTCLPYLLAQIDLIGPQVIVALGATAVEGLLGKSTGITRLRGQWLTLRDIPVMPTYHPAYLLRNESLAEKRKVWEDMLRVLEKLGCPISQKQRNYFRAA